MTMSAQSKKELEENVAKLNAKVEVLNEMLAEKERTIGELQQAKASLEMRVKQLEEQLASAPQATSTGIPSRLTSVNDTLRARTIQYLGQESYDRLLPMVMDPDRVEPLMQKCYENGFSSMGVEWDKVTKKGSDIDRRMLNLMKGGNVQDCLLKIRGPLYWDKNPRFRQ